MSLIFKTLVLGLAASTLAAPAYEAPNAQITPSTLITSTKAATSTSAPAPADTQKALAELLRTKVTAVDRMKALLFDANGNIKTGDALRQQTVFDFSNAKPAKNEFGGSKAAATVANFPILTEMGLSTTVAFLSACGMNTPHVHPRGNEFLTVVNGTVEFGMILENGIANEITGTLNKFQGAVFPQGSIHYQFNPTCNDATFVATLNNEDAGTNQVAQGFFGLNNEVVKAAIGYPVPSKGEDIETFRKNIPLSLAQGIERCLRTCNIAKKSPVA